MRQPEHLACCSRAAAPGGHLYPGIAVARALVRRHRRASGRVRGNGPRHRGSCPGAARGFRFEPIRSAGLMGKSPRAVAEDRGSMAPLTLFDAARVLRRIRPDLVIGLGGYSAGPVVLLAALARRRDHVDGAECGAGDDQPNAGPDRAGRGGFVRDDGHPASGPRRSLPATRCERTSSTWREWIEPAGRVRRRCSFSGDPRGLTSSMPRWSERPAPLPRRPTAST